MNNLNFKKFRSDLVKEILTKPKNARKEILMKAKQTDEYQQAEKKFFNELPIQRFETRIKETILNNESCLIIGATGSGKTTEIPGYLLDILEGKILVTQPRPLAASSIGKYVASKRDVPIGQEIGYQIRFDNHTTEGTRLNFITDGIFLRIIQSNPLLEGYSAVMVDEAHERSQNIDFSLGLLKATQIKRKEQGLPPLKIIISSATIEKEKFAQYFDSAPALEIPGRLYPVKISYETYNPVPNQIPSLAADKVKEILTTSQAGDILIFMPGEQEISKTIEAINLEVSNKDNIEILPLYGQMDPESQNKIFTKNGKRKIIVSTNIAETSLTIPGIIYVIDSCLIKQIKYDPDKGIQSLETNMHSQSGLTQRAGRAGRVQPGFCYRLCTEAAFDQADKFSTPEILRANLSNVILTMKSLKISPDTFDFIDQPGVKNIQEAITILKEIGALDREGNITQDGEIMNELPLEPHLGRILVESERYNNAETIVTITAFLSGKNVFVRPKEKARQADEVHEQFEDNDSDFITFLNVWKAYEKSNYSYRWAVDNFLNPKVLNEIKEIRLQLLRILRKNNIKAEKNEDPDKIGLCITAGLLDKLFLSSGFHTYQHKSKYDGHDSSSAYIHPSSVLFSKNPDLFVCNKVVETSKPFALDCQTVKPEWIFKLAPDLYELERSSYLYDPEQDKIFEEKTHRLLDSDVKVIERDYDNVPESKKTANIYFAGDRSFIEKYIPFESNEEVFNKLYEFYIKDKDKSGYKPWTYKYQHDAYYIFLLGEINSRQKFLKAIEEGTINFKIKLEDLISKEDQDRINEENPSKIVINGIEYQISYKFYNGAEYNRKCTIEMKKEDFINLTTWPQTPSQEKLMILINGAEYDPQKTNLDATKENIVAQIKTSCFLQAEKDGILEKKVITDFSLETDIKHYLYPPTEYGTNPLNQQPFVSYPGLDAQLVTIWGEKRSVNNYNNSNFNDITIFSRHFLDEEEANRTTENTIEAFKIIEKQRVIEQKSSQMIEEIEKFKQEMESEAPSFIEWSKYLTYSQQEKLSYFIQNCEEAKEEKDWANFQENFDRLQETIKRYKEVAKNIEMIPVAIQQYYQRCPVCGGLLNSSLKCWEDHPKERFNSDERTILISGIVNERDELVVGVMATVQAMLKGKYEIEVVRSDNSRSDNYYNLKNAGPKLWDNETPFSELKLKDFKMIWNPNQFYEEHKQKMIQYYKDNPSEYYEKVKELETYVLENKSWYKGKFKRGINPFTDKEAWYTEVNGVKFFLEIDSRIPPPSSENFEYFFYTKKYNGGSDCRSYIVEPLPEYEPKQSNERKETTETQDSVAELVEQWRQKNQKL